MRIIDRYMLRQFLHVYFICFVSLTGLFVVIDSFGNLDEFIEFSEGKGNLIGVMAPYYAVRCLSFFDRISGILALISAMFTIAWIQRHQELTALLAAGIPTFRVIAPVVFAAASVSALAVANREFMLPHVREDLSRNAQDLSGEMARDMQPRYDNASEILLRGSKMYAADQRINQPNFMLPPELGKFGSTLVAADAFFTPADGDRPAGYRLQGVTEPKELLAAPSLALEGRPIVLTPADHPWLNPKELFVVSDVSFDMLASGSGWYQYASTLELIRGLNSANLDVGADARVAVHARLVQPALDITLLFLGLPLVLSKNNRNVFKAIGLCVVVAVTFMLVVLGCQSLGTNYLVSPAKSAWLPLMIFVPVAMLMSEPLRE